jgi:hypothetical protein
MKLDIVSVDRAFEQARLVRTFESAGDSFPHLTSIQSLVCAFSRTAQFDIHVPAGVVMHASSRSNDSAMARCSLSPYNKDPLGIESHKQNLRSGVEACIRGT